MREFEAPRTEPVGEPADPRVAQRIAHRVRDARASLTYRWLERIADRVSVERGEIFPSEALLNHVPLLIEAVAAALEQGSPGSTAERAVLEKAAELGETRYRQGFSAFQVLKEFDILGGILLSYLTEIAPDVVPAAAPREVFLVAHRLHRALSAIQQATAARHLALLDLRVHTREERLRAVHAHIERHVKPRLAGALELAHRGEAGELEGNLEVLRAQMDAVLAISSLQECARQQRNVPLGSAVREAVRQVRGLAAARGVRLEMDEPFPDVEVNAAAVELCLLSYLASAIRYASEPPGSASVRVRADILSRSDAESELVVEVRDNGRAAPRDSRNPLLQAYLLPFEEIAEVPAAGLSFARDTVEALGGRAWAERTAEPDGSIFAFSLPCRRAEDAAAPAGG